MRISSHRRHAYLAQLALLSLLSSAAGARAHVTVEIQAAERP